MRLTWKDPEPQITFIVKRDYDGHEVSCLIDSEMMNADAIKVAKQLHEIADEIEKRLEGERR